MKQLRHYLIICTLGSLIPTFVVMAGAICKQRTAYVDRVLCVAQFLDVERPEDGKHEAGGSGYAFYWNEIATSKSFAMRVAKATGQVGGCPPRFGADTDIDPSVPVERLQLTLYYGPPTLPSSLSDNLKDSLRSTFSEGRRIYIEELASRNVKATPVGEVSFVVSPPYNRSMASMQLILFCLVFVFFPSFIGCSSVYAVMRSARSRQIAP